MPGAPGPVMVGEQDGEVVDREVNRRSSPRGNTKKASNCVQEKLMGAYGTEGGKIFHKHLCKDHHQTRNTTVFGYLA